MHPKTPDVPRRSVDGVLLGLTLTMAVGFNPMVTSSFGPGTAHAKPAVVTGGVATPGPATKLSGGSGPVRFSATLDRHSVMVGRDGEVRAEIVIEADDVPSTAERKDTDLVVILDKSGSMRGDKIRFARAAVRELVGQLGPSDRFALVTYSDNAHTAIELEPASRTAKDGWLSTVEAIGADGYTNMSGGMDRAFDLIEKHRLPGRAARAVLISDGLPNLGDPSPDGLVRRASRAPKGDYVMTAVGVGADFNEFLMTRLADAGTGNYHYLASGGNLGAIFANELSTARTTVASGVTVSLRPRPGVSVIDASGYPLETQRDGSVVVRPGILFGGQQRRIWVTFRVRADSDGSVPLAGIALAWNHEGRDYVASLDSVPTVTAVRDETRYYGDFDKENWERSVVTEKWNKTRQDVSKAVSSGKKAEALTILRDYRASTSADNANIGSAVVDDNLEEAADLEAEIGEAFSGEGQAEKQNSFSKSQSEDAYKSRRVGQVKQ